MAEAKFIRPYTPVKWKSLKTGNEFDYNDYINHGWGGIKNGKMDLPMDEYPYTIIYVEPDIPLWKLNNK